MGGCRGGCGGGGDHVGAGMAGGDGYEDGGDGVVMVKVD